MVHYLVIVFTLHFMPARKFIFSIHCVPTASVAITQAIFTPEISLCGGHFLLFLSGLFYIAITQAILTPEWADINRK